MSLIRMLGCVCLDYFLSIHTSQPHNISLSSPPFLLLSLVILAPLKGWAGLNSALQDMSEGISTSARSISRRPKSISSLGWFFRILMELY